MKHSSKHMLSEKSAQFVSRNAAKINITWTKAFFLFIIIMLPYWKITIIKENKLTAVLFCRKKCDTYTIHCILQLLLLFIYHMDKSCFVYVSDASVIRWIKKLCKTATFLPRTQ